MKNTETNRFEVWAKNHWRLCEFSLDRNPHQSDEYSEPEIQDSWEAWEASSKERRLQRELKEMEL